jgi:pimeloyl-ACP methyl ester carboxylesterase
MTNASTTGYARVNRLDLYYETYGTGEPLILLHGGFGALEMFSDLVPLLRPTRQVIVVDLQGHGRTADIGRPFSFDSMADDVAGLITHFGIGPADVMGYSLGGGVARRAFCSTARADAGSLTNFRQLEPDCLVATATRVLAVCRIGQKSTISALSTLVQAVPCDSVAS